MHYQSAYICCTNLAVSVWAGHCSVAGWSRTDPAGWSGGRRSAGLSRLFGFLPWLLPPAAPCRLLSSGCHLQPSLAAEPLLQTSCQRLIRKDAFSASGCSPAPIFHFDFYALDCYVESILTATVQMGFLRVETPVSCCSSTKSSPVTLAKVFPRFGSLASGDSALQIP